MMSILNSTTEARCEASHEVVPMAKPATKSYPARPRKVAPDHPGAGIGLILEDIDLSIRQAAIMMGVSHNALANLIKGEADISPEMAVRLAVFMGNGESVLGGTEFWLRLQLAYDAWNALEKLKGDIGKIKPAPKAAVYIDPQIPNWWIVEYGDEWFLVPPAQGGWMRRKATIAPNPKRLERAADHQALSIGIPGR